MRAAQLTLPDQANPAGNVHGGEIMRFMADNGGMLAAKRFANSGPESAGRVVEASFVAMSHMSFWHPVLVGDLLEVEAVVVNSGSSSIEVRVRVFADNLVGNRRLSNEALLWYVAMERRATAAAPHAAHAAHALGSSAQRAAAAWGGDALFTQYEPFRGPVPRVRFESAGAAAAAAERYAAQRRHQRESLRGLELYEAAARPQWSSVLSSIVLPSQCYLTSLCQGGEVLKSMDNCAALAALRHCRTNVVTAHIDSVDFHRPVRNGNLLRTSSRPCFASSKSLEIEVLVEAEDLATGMSWVAARGLLVFVSLDAAGRPLTVPPLPPPQDDAERASRDAGRARYELRKREHSKAAASSTTTTTYRC